jgi:hypothetical protein
MHVILEALAYFVGAGVILYFLDKLGYGLESVIKKALDAAVVPKLDEVIRRLEALEHK